MKKKKLINQLNKIKISWRVWLALWVIALLLPISLKILFKPKKTIAWWDSSWAYRKQITVTNNEASTLTNFQVPITFDTATLIEEGKLRANCTDLRVVDSTDTSTYPHYIEDCNSSSSRVWVKVTSLPSGDTTLYFYYGNSSASNINSGVDVFEFFDDFSFDSTYQYTITKNEASNTETWNQDTHMLEVRTGNNYNTTLSQQVSSMPSSGRAVISFEKIADYPADNSSYLSIENSSTSDNYKFVWAGSGYSTQGVSKTVSSVETDSSTETGTVDTDGDTYTIETYWSPTAIRLDIDGSQRKQISPTTNTDDISPDTFSYYNYQLDLNIDYIFIAKDTANRPTSAASSEEIKPAASGDQVVSHWKFDSQSGQAAYDTENNYHAILGASSSAESSDPTWKTQSVCKVNGCLDFDGTDDYVSVPHNDAIDFGNGTTDEAFSLSAWIYMDDATTFRIIEKMDDTDPGTLPDGWALSTTDSDELFFRVYDGGFSEEEINSVTSGTVTSYESQWIHVTATYDGSKTGTGINLYINGQLIDQTRSTGGSYNGFDDKGDPLEIGRALYSSYSYSNGLIDEVKIHNYELTAAQVLSEYNFGSGMVHGVSTIKSSVLDSGAGNPPVLEWNIDDKTGTTVKDSSGNDNNGTIYNYNYASWKSSPDCHQGGCLSFDADNSQRAATSSVPTTKTTDLTFQGWFYWTGESESYVQVMMHNGSTSANGYGLLIGDGACSAGSEINVLLAGGGGSCDAVNSSTNMPSGEWVFLTVTSSSNDWTLYMNGEAIHSGSDSGTSTPTGGFGAGANYSGGSYFNGRADDIKVFDYVRSQDQILYDYYQGASNYYWSFDDVYGDTAVNVQESGTGDGDLGGSGQACPSSSDSSCPTWTSSGKADGALDFETSGTTDDYVDMGDLFYNDELTVCAWVNGETLDSNARTVIAKRNSSGTTAGSNEWSLYVEDQIAKFQGWSSSSAVVNLYSTTSLSTSQWYHLCAVQNGDGNVAYLYVNGNQEDTYTQWDVIQNTSSSVQVGVRTSDDDNTYWDGQIDEIKIFKYGLSSTQVIQEYNKASGDSYGVFGDEADDISDGSGNPPYIYYKLDEKTGTTAYDHSGNGNNGTFGGGTASYYPTWATLGKIGAALDFDGSDDYVDMGNWTSEDTSYTIEFWMNADAATGTDRMIMRGNSIYCFYNPSIKFTGTGISFQESGCSGEGEMGTVTASTDEWIHVAMTRDGETTKAYVNGRLELIDTSLGDPTSTSGGKQILGARNTDGTIEYHYDGKLDEVKIYDYARTAAQIAYDYNRGRPVAYWKLDDCSGSTAYDSSGNSINGTVVIGGSGSQTSAGTCTTSGAWYNGRTGKYQSSLNFDGTDDYVNLSGSSTELQITGAISISSWVKTSSSGSYQVVVDDLGADTFTSWSQWLDGSGKVGWYSGGGWLTSTDAVNDGSWHHIVTTVDSSDTLKFYIDGVLDSTYSSVDSRSATSDDKAIGRRSDSNTYNFTGQIDDVRIYNYDLSANQVKKIMLLDSAVHFE